MDDSEPADRARSAASVATKLAIALVIALVLSVTAPGLLANVGIRAADALGEQDPKSPARFVVSNDGILPIWDVRTHCKVEQVRFLNGDRVADTSFGAPSPIDEVSLPPGGAVTVACSVRALVKFTSGIDRIDYRARATYRVVPDWIAWGDLFDRDRQQRFVSPRDPDGTFRLFPIDDD